MDSLFLDVAHFWPAVGHAMLREFVGLGCGQCGPQAQLVREAGVWVDAATIDAHLARLEAMRTTFRSPSDRCGQLVAEVLRAETTTSGRGSGARPAR